MSAHSIHQQPGHLSPKKPCTWHIVKFLLICMKEWKQLIIPYSHCPQVKFAAVEASTSKKLPWGNSGASFNANSFCTILEIGSQNRIPVIPSTCFVAACSGLSNYAASTGKFWKRHLVRMVLWPETPGHRLPNPQGATSLILMPIECQCT